MNINDFRTSFFIVFTILMLGFNNSCSNLGDVSRFESVPEGCLMVLNCKDSKAFKVFFEDSKSYSIDEIEAINTDFSKFLNLKIDSVLHKKAFLSILAPIAAKEYELVYVLELDELSSKSLNTLIHSKPEHISHFDKIPIFHFGTALSVSKIKNLLIFSTKRLLVENVIRQIKSGTNAKKHYVENENQYDVSVWLDLDKMLNFTKPNFKSEFGLSELNLYYQFNHPYDIDGSLYSSKNIQNLAHFWDEEVLQVIPNNVFYFQNQLSVPQVSNPWCDDKFTKVFVPSVNGNAAKSDFYIFKILDEEKYDVFVKNIKSTQNIDDYNGFELLETDQLIPNQSTFCCDMNGFVVASMDKQALKIWIDYFISGQILGRNIAFLTLYQKRTISPNTYINFDLLADYIKLNVKKNTSSKKSFLSSLSGFGQVLLNVNRQGNHHVFSGVRQEKKLISKSNIVWKTKLDNRIRTQPYILKCNQSSDYKVLFQNQKNRLYALNNQGKIEWNIQLESALISDIIPINYYQDGVEYLIFNTRDAVHIVDCEGNYIKGYPMPLNVKANVGLLAIDFEDDGGVCYYIGCENGRIYGFDKFGTPLQGWNPSFPTGILIQPLQHFQSDTKDFLLGVNTNNELIVYQKNGNPRFDHHFHLDSNVITCNFDDLHSKERIVTFSDNGKAKIVNTKGQTFGLNLSHQRLLDAECLNAIGDARKDFVLLTNRKLTLKYYDQNKIKIAFQTKLTSSYDDVFKVNVGLSKYQIGLFDAKKKRITIIDSLGQQPPNFPLRATQPFGMIPTQNGSSILIGVFKNQIYAYEIK